MIELRILRRAFGKAADGERGRLSTEVGARLLERLDGLRFEPGVVVDLGSGAGLQTRALAERFGSARIVAMDRSLHSLASAGTRRGWFRRRFQRVAADPDALPLAESSVGLLHANLALPWVVDLPALLNAFRRVIEPGGLVLFSTLGPDTLRELRQCRARIGADLDPGAFVDVQTIGDAMLRAGFAEPVLDTDWITSTYRRPADLLAELDGLCPGRVRDRDEAAGLATAYEAFRLDSGLYPATWEVVYASAWGPDEGAPIRSYHGEEASVSIASIGRRRR
jgi:malonyl-CoA O-methyltransferase